MKIREFDIQHLRQADVTPLNGSHDWPPWQYREHQQCGLDYRQAAQVRRYDKRHQRFRDFEQEGQNIVERLRLGPDDTVLDMGCGTGNFSLYAAERVSQVHAVDVSRPMLRWARRKATRRGVQNIQFHQGGFLTYEHRDDPVDAVVCVAALHHLPDFWKQIGLERIVRMLKPRGRFYLFDVVYSFETAEYRQYIGDWIDALSPSAGVNEVVTHIRDEFSTFDWIMQGLLRQAGFAIGHAHRFDAFTAEYVCRKME